MRFAQFILLAASLRDARRNGLLFKSGPFPNRNFFLQLFHYPSTRSKRCFAMSTAHSRKERWFPNSDKPNPVMNDYGSQQKFDRGLLGNLPQLMFGHFAVRFVIDSVDFAPILRAAHNPRKVDCRACVQIDSVLWRIRVALLSLKLRKPDLP